MRRLKVKKFLSYHQKRLRRSPQLAEKKNRLQWGMGSERPVADTDKSEIEFLNQVHRGDRRDSRFLL